MHRNIDEEVSKGNRDLMQVLSQIDNQEEMKMLLDELLTSAEVKDLTLRWLLLNRLENGQTQRKIAQDLGISLCKITRGAGILKRDGSIIKKILDSKIGGDNVQSSD